MLEVGWEGSQAGLVLVELEADASLSCSWFCHLFRTSGFCIRIHQTRQGLESRSSWQTKQQTRMEHGRSLLGE